MPRPLKVFLCHAHSDKDTVKALYVRLKREGVDVWLDKENLLPGADWEYEIRKAVRESDVVIVCLSKQFNQAGFRQKEVRIALEEADKKPEGEIFIIPARLEECDNLESLSRWHWVDLFESDGFQRLILALRIRADKIGAALRQRGATISRQKKNGELQAADNESRYIAEQETAEKFAREKAEREKAEQDAADKLTREKAEREAAEKASREKAEREKAEKDAADKLAREKKERELSREKVEKDAAEKVARKKLEREKTEKVAADKLAREKAMRENAKRQTPIKTASKKEEIITTPKNNMAFPVGMGIVLIVIFLIGVSLIPKSQLNESISIQNTKTPTSTLVVKPPTSIFPSVTSTSMPTLTYAVTPTHKPSSTPTFEKVLPIVSDKDGMVMVYVPAGSFMMGSGSDEHQVNLDAFWIDQTEVTNKMYAICVSAGKCTSPYNSLDFRDLANANNPINSVEWNEANTYCKWVGRELPTEAEWEKAARGTDGKTYPWGDNIDCSFSNYNGCVGEIAKVGSYPSGASIYGVMDMAGNVEEWVSSLFMPYPYDENDGREDLTASGPRVLRGGNYSDRDYSVRSAFRIGNFPLYSSYGTGFRCSLSTK